MKNLFLFYFFVGLGPVFAQQIEVFPDVRESALTKTDTVKYIKPNPVVFVEGFMGLIERDLNENSFGLSINYQFRNNLFTYEYIRNSNNNEVYAYIPIEKRHTHNHAILFGQRFVFDNVSLSISTGVSYSSIVRNINKIYSYDAPYIDGETYWGIPVEVNFKLFKNKRKAFNPGRLVGLKKPTGFSSSIGLKIHGSISRHNYIGAGLVFGLGWHKIYGND